MGLVAALMLAMPALSAARVAGSSGADVVPSFGHVFLIIGENTDYAHVDATNTPYLMNTVRPHAAWFDNYYSATHWSQANYVATVSGQFTDCEQDDLGIACRQNVDNLYHRMDLAGMSWKVWLEAGSAKCDGGSGGSCSSDTPCPQSGFYTTGNPPILFTDISSSECQANDIPAGTASAGMSIFNADLASGDVAQFNTIIPTGCEDGESNCKPVNNRYTQYDDFLAKEVPLIESSRAFGRDGVILITYDESERQDGRVPDSGFGNGGHTVLAIISPLIKPGEYPGVTYAYSMLRTLQDGFGTVEPGYLGFAKDVSALPAKWN